MGSAQDTRTTAEIYQEAERANDQVTDGLKNALRIVDDTRDVQANTLAELKHQGDQLGTIQGTLDDVQEDNKYAQAVLDDIGCLCWCFGRKKSNKMTRPIHTPAYKPEKKSSETTKPNGVKGMSRTDATAQVTSNNKQQQTTKDSPDNPVLQRIEEGKKQQETYLDQISKGLDVLQQGAKAMGEELTAQDKIIEQAEVQTDDVRGDLKDTGRHRAFRRYVRN